MRKIAVIGGGDSAEIIISKKSRATIVANLDSTKYEVYSVLIVGNEWVVEQGDKKYIIDKNDFSTIIDGKIVKFDYAYITIHGTPGEDGKLQGYFDLLGIPYNTPNQLVSALTFNKWTCNTLLKQVGFHCANSVLIRKYDSVDVSHILDTVKLPCFVKPNDGGSSFGTSKVKTPDTLLLAIEQAFEHGKEVIIESMLSGTEVTCGIVKINDELKVLGITEIVTENEFFDFQAKYEGKSKEITPARITKQEEEAIHQTVKSIYSQLGIKGVVRIDFMVQEGVPYVIEINTTPGMSDQSIIPQQVKHSGMTLTELFDGILLNS